MNDPWTRRDFIIGAGSVLILGGCTRNYSNQRGEPAATARAQPETPVPVAGPIKQPVEQTPDTPLPMDIPEPSPGNYVVVPRKAWTNLGPGSNNRPMNGIRRITIHHTGEYAAWSDLPDLKVVRSIDNGHRSRGWSTIGYHYLIGKDGRIYEGRPLKYQGAHVSGANDNNLGISVIGDFQTSLPNKKQLSALAKFLDDQRQLFRVAKNKVYGHRDLHKSICPGDALYAWLKKYKAA